MTKLGIASLCFALAAFAPSLAYAEPAQEHYSAGRESYRAGLFARALHEFERSYAAVPSPNTQLYIARSLRDLGRPAEAAEQYRATIREAEERGAKYAAAREAAEAELRDIEVRIERAAPKVEAKTEPVKAVLPVAVRPSPIATATWVSGSVAVAGLATFGVLYGLASDRHAYLEDHCTRVRDAACDDARATGRAEESAAYVALGVAVVAAGLAVVSFVSRVSRNDNDAKAEAGRPWVVRF